MTQIIKRYWKWDERLNDTPYKLGSEISCLLRKGLVHPYQDVQDRFLGLGEGAARHIEIEVSAGKIDFVTFSSPYGLVPMHISLRSRKACGTWRSLSLWKHLIAF